MNTPEPLQAQDTIFTIETTEKGVRLSIKDGSQEISVSVMVGLIAAMADAVKTQALATADLEGTTKDRAMALAHLAGLFASIELAARIAESGFPDATKATITALRPKERGN